MKDFLYDHAAKRPVSFHMPGHKGSMIFKKYGYEKFLDNFMDMDVTEIPGADNLFDAGGIIHSVQERYAALYGAKRSWLSVGGTSASLIAAIMAVLDGSKNAEGDYYNRGRNVDPPKLIMARNCHKSVYNGLALAGGQPVYAYPVINEEYGIAGEVTPPEIRRCISENPDAAGVIVTSPNYYGICSDIKAIADEVHKAGMVLIVDQAHGAHLKFFHEYVSSKIADGSSGLKIPEAAEDQGADIVCNSTHKTLASMTQSAVLNLCSDRVDPEIIGDKLQMIESSSPSYVLMTSLDICAELLENHGAQLMGQWRSNLDHFYEQAGKIDGLGVMPGSENSNTGFSFDRTKLNLDLCMPGADAEKLLNERGIFPELYAGNLLMCMTGIGNSREDYDALLCALKEIMESASERSKWPETENESGGSDFEPASSNSESASNDFEPARAYPRPGRFVGVPAVNEKIHFTRAEGMICAASIIPYPPGVPLVCPGEEITSEIISFIDELRKRKEKILGIDEGGMIRAKSYT